MKKTTLMWNSTGEDQLHYIYVDNQTGPNEKILRIKPTNMKNISIFIIPGLKFPGIDWVEYWGFE